MMPPPLTLFNEREREGERERERERERYLLLKTLNLEPAGNHLTNLSRWLLN
jgi:hypothetical protein